MHRNRQSIPNPSPASPPGRLAARRLGQQAAARVPPLLVILVCLAVGAGSMWLFTNSQRGPASPGQGSRGAATVPLSDATRAVLSRLTSPVEVRFYDILDPATVPASLNVFADRVGQLLAAYDEAADGKIKLTRIGPQSNSGPNAALKDGLQPFNQQKGEACYFGIALLSNGQKETLPRLAPEWEQALEPDVTRAIAHLENPAAGPAGPGAVSLVSTAAVQQVKTLIPNPAAVSLPQGQDILRAAALKDFAAAANEMQQQVDEADQRLKQATIAGSEAEKQAALQNLQKVQAAQSEKLQQIATRLKAQIDAFHQLKTAPQ